MAAIKVNNEVFHADDFCIDPNSDHASMIEYWAMHEIEDLCESKDIEDRLIKLVSDFAETPEANSLSFTAVLDGENRRIKIEKI